MGKFTKPAKYTLIILGIVAAILIGWDLYVYFGNDVSDDTISHLIQWMGSNWAIPFSIGAVFIGHFFWPGNPIIRQPLAFMIISIPWVIVLIIGLFGALPNIPAMIPAAIGIVCGRLFWPQSKPK